MKIVKKYSDALLYSLLFVACMVALKLPMGELAQPFEARQSPPVQTTVAIDDSRYRK